MGNGLIRDIDFHDSVLYPSYQAPVTVASELTSIVTEFCKQMKITNIKGMTIVNLLGNDGDCEDVSKFTYWQSTLALDSSNKVFGSNGIKVTSTVTGYSSLISTKQLTVGSYYYATAYVKNGNSGGNIYIETPSNSYTMVKGSNDTTKFVRIATKFQAQNASQQIAIYSATTVVGQYFNIDGIMLEEITAAQYADSNFVPSPYVNGDYSVGDSLTRIKARGKNLINLVQGNISSINAYNFVVSTTRLTHKDGVIVVKPNTTYTISLNTALYYGIAELDSNRNFITQTGWSGSSATLVTYTTGANTKYLAINFKIDDSTTIFAENYQIQIEEGSSPTAYEKYCETYLNTQYPLRSLPSGVVDEIKDNIYVKKIEKVILDGSLNWTFGVNYIGYKSLLLSLSNQLLDTGYVYKYNNKLLRRRNASGDSWTGEDNQQLNSTQLYITVSSADSGWGDSYTPSSIEIQAERFGYKMNNGTFGTPYNGTGTKTWTTKYATDNTGSTTTCPTSLAPNFTPDRLYYQLATPIITELNQPNLVAYPNGSLIMESDSQSWVRPSVTYQIADNTKANQDELMKGLSDSKRDVLGKFDKTGGTLTGDVIINKSVPTISFDPNRKNKSSISWNASSSSDYGMVFKVDGNNTMIMYSDGRIVDKDLYNVLRAISGGYKIQSGTVTTAATSSAYLNTAVTFPAAFAGTPIVIITPVNGANNSQIAKNSSTGMDYSVYGTSTTGFTLISNQTAVAITYNWMAIGV